MEPKHKADDVEPTLDGEAFVVKKKKKTTGKETFWCELCHVECPTKAMLDVHSKGKRHKAKESAKEEFENVEYFYCHICDVWCNSEIMLKAHLGGKKHKVKKSKKDGIGDDPIGKNGEKAGLWCKICEVGCSSEAVMVNHVNGKKHKAKEAKDRMHKEDVLTMVCDEKEGTCSDPQGQVSSNEKKDEIFDLGSDKNEEESNLQDPMNTGEKEEEVLDVGCKEDGEGSDPQGQNDTKESGNGKGLNCEEPKEFWCLICRVKCDSRLTIARHLKGMEHKATQAKRFGKND